MYKEKGFDKPIKYLFIGKPNLTKTTLAKKIGLKIFETDGLDPEDILDISKYDLNSDIFIIGGKYYGERNRIINLLLENFGSFNLITLNFEKVTQSILEKRLQFWIERDGGENGDLVYVYLEDEDKVLIFEMDNSDGYRSHCDPQPKEESDLEIVMKWFNNPKESLIYDKIEFSFEEKSSSGSSYDEDAFVEVRASFKERVVFEIGTENYDDYYPHYYMNVNGKEWENWGNKTNG